MSWRRWSGTINNGALDNAIGIASLIEEAKRFRSAGAPKRSVMFLAVTAEEKGLVGSDYFANHPTVPIATIVADVNLDMPILWDQAVRFVDANYRIARDIADAPTRPVWNPGDYFGMLFKGPMAAR